MKKTIRAIHHGHRTFSVLLFLLWIFVKKVVLSLWNHFVIEVLWKSLRRKGVNSVMHGLIEPVKPVWFFFVSSFWLLGQYIYLFRFLSSLNLDRQHVCRSLSSFLSGL